MNQKMGALVLQSATEFTPVIANQTLADWAGEEIVEVSVAALGEALVGVVGAQ